MYMYMWTNYYVSTNCTATDKSLNERDLEKTIGEQQEQTRLMESHENLETSKRYIIGFF